MCEIKCYICEKSCVLEKGATYVTYVTFVTCVKNVVYMILHANKWKLIIDVIEFKDIIDIKYIEDITEFKDIIYIMIY